MNRTLRILYIEDNPADAELCLRELKKAGLSVSADVVQTAADMTARLRSTDYDIILSDFNLPNWSGMEAFDLARSEGKDIPFVLVSGSMVEKMAIECITRGATDHINKNRAERLPLVVRRAIKEKELRDGLLWAEREIKRSEQTHRSLIQAAQYAIFRFSPRRDCFLSVNPAFVEMLGYDSEEELLTVKLSAALYGGVENTAKLCQMFEQQSDVRDLETEWKRKDGDLILVRMTGHNISDGHGADARVECVAENLTGRKRGEAALARLAAIVESSEDAIAGVGLDDIVTSWNSGAERMFGYSSREAVGHPICRVISCQGTDAPAGSQWAERIAHHETICTSKDGRQIPVSMTVSPIRDAAGIVIGKSLIARDISEHRRLYDQIQEQMRELEEQNRIVLLASRMKNEFLANMSHELRSPLNAIIGFGELLYDGRLGVNAELHKEVLGHILGSSQHLLRLINDILDLAKVESGTLEFWPEPVRLEELIRDVIDMLGALAMQKGIRISTEIAPEVNRVAADPSKLKQILYNYLSNALKFTPDSGRVTVRIKPEGCDQFCLEVEDSGIGIMPDDVSRLFVHFQQLDGGTSKRYQGTGLGLALTKRISEAQGGRVGVRSVPGVGSVFFTVLPRICPRLVLTQSADAPDSQTSAELRPA